ncbi:RecQ family ATP-dependent DNA helicase [Haloferula rosea]|nr:RecQ family ATP-dependent DNA helicase [Haloferula rosea]
MPHNSTRALELLRLGTQNPSAEFRDGQEEAIRHVVEGLGRLLVVQKTGWGKSSVYFIATKLLREQGLGPAILISPLLSLMRNQIAAAERMGVRALTIHSGNTADWDEVKERVRNDEVDILLISPERLSNEYFRNEVLGPVAGRISLLVVDEAHCISDWGHDFRPHYRFIERIVRQLPANLRLLATTATANERVMNDLEQILGPNLEVSRGELGRPSLFLQTIRLAGQAERLAWLAQHLPGIPGSGIVYTLTVRDAAQVAEWLRSRGIEARAYSGQSGDERPELEDALLRNEVKVLAATTALGMGFDKPDLAFVIHFQMPGSVVAYYQQVGRAGRNIDSAYGILLSGVEEQEINDYFIESAFPKREEVSAVLDALGEAEEGFSVPELMARVNATMGRIDKALLLMSLESPAAVVKEGTKWRLTAAGLSEDFWIRAERLTSLRRDEQQQMKDYVDLETGHMEFLISALDGDPAGYVPPGVPEIAQDVEPGLIWEAESFLRRTGLPLEPRKRWPNGGLPQMGVRGNLAEELRAESGRVLCYWGGAGWGEEVRRGKYHDARFSDDLVAACVAMVGDWNPHPAPEWVTCVPSLRHPDLVPDFARRLAAALGLPFFETLRKTDARPEQKTMANSIQQARNIDGSLEILSGSVREGSVLLVDDMVDSKWTLTVAAYLLRQQGSGPIHPLALATTAHAE